MIYHNSKNKAFLIPRNDIKHVDLKATVSRHKILQYDGAPYVAVPDDLATCQRLAQFGVNLPTGILRDYKWSGPWTPFEHQAVTADFMVRHPRAFIFNDIGTGKTLATLWAIDYLQSIGAMGKVLISCPMSVMETVWGDSLFIHFPHKRFEILHGSKDKRIQLLNRDADIYIINHDGVKVIKEQLRNDRRITTVIIDELAVMRTKKADVTKAHYSIAGPHSGRQNCWGLTGSPMPTKPTDIWAQARIVNQKVVPVYFTRLRNQIMLQKVINERLVWYPRPGWESIVYSMVQPSIRFKRSDCIDLPPCTTIQKKAMMSKEQQKAYDALQRECLAELDDGTSIVAVNEAVKINKFLQISSGCVYDSDKNSHLLPCRTKLSLLLESIEEAGGKAVVYTPFRATLKPLHNVITKAGYRVAVIHSGVKASERADIFREFQRKGSTIDVLLAIPGCIKYGVDLTASGIVINYGAVDNYDIAHQSAGRITRPGQTKPQTIINLVVSKAEEKVHKRNETKERLQGLLLELLEH